MALLMLRRSGFQGSAYAKEVRVPCSPYPKGLRVPWLSLCQEAKGSMSLLMLRSSRFHRQSMLLLMASRVCTLVLF